MKFTDIELKEEIIHHLEWDPWIDVVDISVYVKDGNVKLSGTVPNFRAKKFASINAKLIKGVEKVENHLKVVTSDQHDISDKEIKRNIKFVQDITSTADYSNVKIIVENGVVILNGTVDYYWEKKEIEDLTLNINGVVDIINKIVIIPTHKSNDEKIAKTIIKKLEQNPVINIDKINIQVKNGVVYLTGTVLHRINYKMIMNTLEFTKGVEDIEEDLAIIE